MKKNVFILILLIMVSILPAFAQGLYFDAGGGAAFSGIANDDQWVNKGGYNAGLKAGYGPFGALPLYVAAHFDYMGYFGDGYDFTWKHQDRSNPNPDILEKSLKSQYSLFFGLGAIYYPIQQIQLGVSLGYSGLKSSHFFIQRKNLETPQRFTGDDFVDGFGWNISAAYDWGKNNHGCLIGVQYIGAINHIFVNPLQRDNHAKDQMFDFTRLSTSFGIFVKYTYRKKAGNLTDQRPSRSNTGIDGAIGRAGQELVNKLPEKTTLAVINISSNDGNLSSRVIDELEFHLVSSGKFTIVNRNMLNTVRGEQNFQMSGEVSDESAVSIGQMLGANIVITGSITETETGKRLIIMALDVRTAEIIAMAREDY